MVVLPVPFTPTIRMTSGLAPVWSSRGRQSMRLTSIVRSPATACDASFIPIRSASARRSADSRSPTSVPRSAVIRVSSTASQKSSSIGP